MALTLESAAQFLGREPRVGVILGSGLGAATRSVQGAQVLRAKDIEGYPTPTTAGHRGRIITGKLGGRAVVCLEGRVHRYEGQHIRHITTPLGLLHQVGVESIIICAAAGGMGVPAGTLLFVTDYMRMGPGPAVGQQGTRTPFDPAWTLQAQRIAVENSIPCARGTMLWTVGPSYETKAEIQFCRQRGADAVGMSMLPEVLEARRLGMRVLGLALITNAAAGLQKGVLSHEDVLRSASRLSGHLRKLLPEMVRSAPRNHATPDA